MEKVKLLLHSCHCLGKIHFSDVVTTGATDVLLRSVC